MSSELLISLVGESKIKSIKAKVSGNGARLQNGIDPASIQGWIDQQFGQFGQKILFTSSGVEDMRQNDFTVMGGWCAIRTADLILLQQGLTTDPVTGEQIKYRDAIEVARWIKNSSSIDQIVESVGIYAGTNYAVVSEERLWAQRVISIVGKTIGEPLSEKSERVIENAVQMAELGRYGMTKRYIEYIVGQEIDLQRIPDTTIYDDLVRVRDEMLNEAGISLTKLMKMYPDDKSIPGYSVVWGMYTGPYLALLKQRGFVKTPKGVIVEPWAHATSETPAKSEVNNRLFNTREQAYYPKARSYLDPKGPQKNLGMIVYADSLLPTGERMRLIKSVDMIPNERNYWEFIKKLQIDPATTSIDLSSNPAFMWGVNLLPFGDCYTDLMWMVQLRKEYKEERKKIVSDKGRRNENSIVAQALKDEYENSIRDAAERVIMQLAEMLRYVFGEEQYRYDIE